MNPFEMVVMIVLIVTIGRVAAGRVSSRRAHSAVMFADAAAPDSAAVAEAARLRGEVNRLNERIQVLERLATDPGKRLSDEIEALKDK